MSGSPPRGRRAAAVFALCLACASRETYFGAGIDAGGADVAPEASDDALRDAARDAASDRPGASDAPVDLGPACVVGGTSALLPATVDCTDATPGQIAVSGDHVYWTVQGSGAMLFRAPLTGGGAEPLAFDVAGGFGILVDAGFVYVAQPVLGRIVRVPIEGGVATPLVTNLFEPWLLATDGANLYWTEGENDEGKVRKLALAPAATPVTLMDGLPHPRAIAVRDGFVYWTDIADMDPQSGTVYRSPDHLLGPADAGVQTASRLATGLYNPTTLLLLGDFIYFTDWNGHIWRLPLAGGDLDEVAAVDGMPYAVTTDGTSLYWSLRGDAGGIFTAPPASCPGCKFKPLATNQFDPHFVAVSAENIFWSTWGPNPAIHRIAK